MKIILTLITVIYFSGCSNNPFKSDNIKLPEIDSCKNAVKFPNAKMTEQMVKSDFTGDLNNYWGEDTSRIDFKHTFRNGELIQSKFYYYNGFVEEEYNYKCQSLHGEIRYYYKNGKLSKVIPYRYGRREGTGLLYDTLGVLLQKVIFENDSIVDEQIIADNN